MILEGECVHDIQLVFFELESQRGFEGGTEHFAGQVVFVIARLGAKDRASFAPKWISNFSDPRPARSLLAPRLLSATRNLASSLGLMRSGALARQILFDGVVQQTF